MKNKIIIVLVEKEKHFQFIKLICNTSLIKGEDNLDMCPEKQKLGRPQNRKLWTIETKVWALIGNNIHTGTLALVESTQRQGDVTIVGIISS